MAGILRRFCPHDFRERVSDIDVDALKAGGVDALILDLDNTLLPWKGSEVPDWSREWIERAKQAGLKLCILSNTHYPARLRRIADRLGVPAFHGALKPRKGGFTRAARMLDVAPARIAVVGDQIMTDILGGNLAGMRTILVRPIGRREFIGTKISRLLERLIMKLLRARGMLGTITGTTQSQKQDTT